MIGTPILRTAALGLILSALTVHTTQAAPTRITAPQIITAPGSYLLANDITSTGEGAAIEIQTSDVMLNLNGHTINASQGAGILIDEHDVNNNNAPVVNAHVSNGQLVVAGYGVIIYASSCSVNGLNITVGPSGIPIQIEYGNSNRVRGCVLSAAKGQTGRAAFSLFLSSNNTIQNNTLAGIYVDTVQEDDQTGSSATVVGNNTFSGNEFALPTE
jgi:hypothetical protein